MSSYYVVVAPTGESAFPRPRIAHPPSDLADSDATSVVFGSAAQDPEDVKIMGPFASLHDARAGSSVLTSKPVSFHVLRSSAGTRMEKNASDKIVSVHEMVVVDLTGAKLERAVLSSADLTGANLTRADLVVADLTEANLEAANLTEAELSAANLTGANLMRANLTDAYLNLAFLTRADLTGAYLTGAHLTGTHTNITGQPASLPTGYEMVDDPDNTGKFILRPTA